MAQKIFFSAEIFVFCIGLLSNSLALATLMLGKRLDNIGTKNMYIYLIMIDTLFLFIMIFDRGLFYNGFDFITYSIWSCKLYPYFNRILATLSPMLLVIKYKNSFIFYVLSFEFFFNVKRFLFQ